jgi:hypothetical protein
VLDDVGQALRASAMMKYAVDPCRAWPASAWRGTMTGMSQVSQISSMAAARPRSAKVVGLAPAGEAPQVGDGGSQPFVGAPQQFTGGRRVELCGQGTLGVVDGCQDRVQR